jgi:predicted O-methyltransferase YrrM
MGKFSTYLSLLKFSLLNPKQGIKLYNELKETKFNDNQKLKNFDVIPKTANELFLSLFDKPFSESNESLIHLENHLKLFFNSKKLLDYPSKNKPYPIDYSILGESGPFLYQLCKLIKPEIVVETGVAYGVSTSYILQALHENNKGKLISVDSIFRPWQSKNMIGSAIPTSLKSRWELYIGSSNEELNKIFQKCSEIDIFLHDSLHTYQNMLFEFTTSWPQIKPGGYLLSDDILGNNAFHNFSEKVKKKPFLLYQKFEPVSLMGIILK